MSGIAKSHNVSCVLVVEDDDPLRKLLTVTLEREGLDVTAVKDGAEAIGCLDRHEYRVVVLDLMMPRVSGWDVIDWLKEHPSSRPRTLIVVTAADRNVFAELEPGIVNAIIVKPFDTYEVSGYVRRCCDAAVDRDRRSKRLVGSA
jgi:DNA-binding response OmpR family regulator